MNTPLKIQSAQEAYEAALGYLHRTKGGILAGGD